jgi:hypothetical protein
MTQDKILDKCHKEYIQKSGIGSIYPSTFPESYKPQTVKAMWDFGEQFAYDFAKFLEEHTEKIREEKITLYRYHAPDGWANYTLEDIFLEFKERYEP